MSLHSWFGAPLNDLGTQASLESVRAILAWRRIRAKPSSISFKTDTGRLAEQTVRIESDSRVSVSESVAGTAPKRKTVVFGIRDHPTLPDTDMNQGYIFTYEGDVYRVQDIILTIGEIQGIAEASR